MNMPYPPVETVERERWYADWQEDEHASRFDGRSVLPDRMLVRNYEAFSDVRILHKQLQASGIHRLLEVGCATGEFHRYLRIRHPEMNYAGVDISRVALERARQKYPRGRFFTVDPGLPLRQGLQAAGLPERWDCVYSKDVIHHQTDPFGFIGQLLEAASALLVFRTRTRDQGPTILDPEQSCQYHYRGWMPYIVLNLRAMVDEIQRRAPGSEILLYRNRMVLGGEGGRFLPKECYLPETGTAETAVGVFLETAQPGRVQVIDRKEMAARYPIGDRILLRLKGRVRRR